MTKDSATVHEESRDITSLLALIGQDIPYLILETLSYLTPEEIKAAITHLPQDDEMLNALFKDDFFWRSKRNRHFPNAQKERKADQTEFDFFWKIYDEEYSHWSERKIKLFSLAKENKLSMKDIKDIHDLNFLDNYFSLLNWVALNRDQTRLNEIYHRFAAEKHKSELSLENWITGPFNQISSNNSKLNHTNLSPVDWAITCLQPLEVVENLAKELIEQATEGKELSEEEKNKFMIMINATMFINAASSGHIELLKGLYNKFTPEQSADLMNYALSAATRRNHLDIVVHLTNWIEKNTPDQYSLGLGEILKLATRRGMTGIVKFASERNAVASDDKKISPDVLFEGWKNATLHGHLAITKLLINKETVKQEGFYAAGVSIALRDSFTKAIAVKGELPVVDHLLSLFPPEVSAEVKKYGLIQAAYHGKLTIVEYFVKDKENPPEKEIITEAFVEAADLPRNLAVISYLLQLPAKLRPTQAVVNDVLKIAARENSLLPILKELSSLTSEIKPDQASVSEALEIAANNQQWEIAQYLSQMTTDIKPSQKSISHTLNEAIRHHQSELALELCQLKSDNQPDVNALQNAFLRLTQTKAQMLDSFLPFVRANKFSQNTLTGVFENLLTTCRFDLATTLFNESPKKNKPFPGEGELWILIFNKQYSLYQTIFKATYKEKFSTKVLKEHLRFAAICTRTPESDEFMHWLKNAASPASYDDLTSQHEDKMDKIVALLDDYTKGNSAVSRFFHGHWNRHYAKKIADLVEQIKAKTIELPEVIAQLKAMQPSNKEGSLARRIQYIVDKIDVEDDTQPDTTIEAKNR